MVKLTPTGVKINTNLVWTSQNTGGVEFNTGVFAVWTIACKGLRYNPWAPWECCTCILFFTSFLFPDSFFYAFPTPTFDRFGLITHVSICNYTAILNLHLLKTSNTGERNVHFRTKTKIQNYIMFNLCPCVSS